MPARVQLFVRLLTLTSMSCNVNRRILRDTGRLLAAFCIGSVATVVGTLAALKVLPLQSLGQDSWKVGATVWQPLHQHTLWHCRAVDFAPPWQQLHLNFNMALA